MVDAIYAPLGKAPEALNGVRMNKPMSIDLSGVLNPLMGITNLAYQVIAPEFVRVNRVTLVARHLFHNQGNQAPSLDIGDYLSHDVPASLNHAHDRSFAFKTTASVATLATEVGLVNLNVTIHRLLGLGHDRPDFVEHSPGCLVGNTQLSLKLFGRDTTASGRNQEHGIEPGTERCGTVVKDGVGCGADLVATELTAKDSTSGNQVVLRNLAALGAKDSFRPASGSQEPKASRIIGELSVKLLQSIRGLFHGLFSLSRFIIPQNVRDVKGYLPKRVIYDSSEMVSDRVLNGNAGCSLWSISLDTAGD